MLKTAIIQSLFFLPRYLVLRLIRFYQKTLSFDHGPLKILHPGGFCRFNPSCSEYGFQAIEKHGLAKGGLKTFWRVLRCHPWSGGGNDSVD